MTKEPTTLADVTALAKILLKERKYSPQEIQYAIKRHGIRKDLLFLPMPQATKEAKQMATWCEFLIKLKRDECYLGTELYQGKAYFWNHKYRHWMRGDAHGNGYRGISIENARRKIHKQFLDEGLDLAGETARHDEIINEVFGDSNYIQEVASYFDYLTLEEVTVCDLCNQPTADYSHVETGLNQPMVVCGDC
jgi:hypothetical protein